MLDQILTTRLTRDYSVRHPFAAAGMAFIGTPELAVAVCHAGGIGAFGAGPLPPPAAGAAIAAIAAEVGDAPFNVNFAIGFTEDAHIEACVESGVPIVSFHWGHPPPRWIDQLHECGTRVWEQVGSVEAASRAVADGVDLIVAQGSEAGGHNFATLPTFAIVPAVVDAVGDRALVLAAGGVADGRGVAAALALGADGVWVGTRLVASAEAGAHPEYKRRLAAADGAGTALTSIFGPEMPDFNPMRVLRNPIVAEHEGREDTVPADTSSEPEIGRMFLGGAETTLRRFSPLVPTAETSADLDQMALLAGQGVGLITDVSSVEVIVDTMIGDAADRLATLAPEPTGESAGAADR